MAVASSEFEQRLVVDQRLGAVPMNRLIEARDALALRGRLSLPPIVQEGGRPVIEGGQTLQPDVVYPSERDPNLGYYLPRYAVQRDAAGRPAVELKYDPAAAAADPAAGVGSLALTLAWTSPVAVATMRLRPLDHVVTLALRYRIGVQDMAAGMGLETTLALQPLQPVGEGLARSLTTVADKALFDGLYQALRTPASGASLQLQVRARVGVRTWRQVYVGTVAEELQAGPLLAREALITRTVVARDPLRRVAPGALTPVVMSPPIIAPPAPRSLAPAPGTAPAGARAAMLRPVGGTAALPADRVAARPVVAPASSVRRPVAATMPLDRAPVRIARPAAPVVAAPAAQPVVAAPLRPIASDQVFLRPRLSEAVETSDLVIGGRRVVPTRVPLDRRRRPAIVDADLENEQALAFSFDPREPANAAVYLAQGYAEALHLLLPLTLTKDGRTYRVYQDNLMRDVVHVAPSGFRVQRQWSAPFRPQLTLLASEFGTTEGGDDANAQVMFRVAMGYRLEPWIDPVVVELTRAALAEQQLVPRLTTQLPADAKLTLDLDLPGTAKARADARVRAEGIDDTLEVDHNAFVRLWRERLAAPGGGIDGQVDYTLFDGTAVSVKARISFWDSDAELCDVALLGSVEGQPTRCRVSVRNRIESPVRIIELPPELLPGGGFATPVEPGQWLERTLQPQEAVQIDYDFGATPPGGDFDPSVIARTEPRFDVLLRLLLMTQGYPSLGFPLVIGAAAGSFAAAADAPATADALSGLLVEFDDGTRSTLTPALPQAEVQLMGRLIDQLNGRGDEAQRYFYRVTNLHAAGEGARTGWLEGQGSNPLQVGPVQATLPF